MRCEVVRQDIQWRTEVVYDGPKDIDELDQLRRRTAIYGVYGSRGPETEEADPILDALIERMKTMKISHLGEEITAGAYRVKVALSPNEVIETYGNMEPYQAVLIYAQKGKLSNAQFRRNFPGARATLVFHTNL